VPGDCFAFTVLICCEDQLIGIFKELFELINLLLLIGVDDIERGEFVLDIDALARPGKLLKLLWDVRGPLWQVADMSNRGFYYITLAKIASDFLRFGRGLNDDELGK
jgi:hypothetical protein